MGKGIDGGLEWLGSNRCRSRGWLRKCRVWNGRMEEVGSRMLCGLQCQWRRLVAGRRSRTSECRVRCGWGFR